MVRARGSFARGGRGPLVRGVRHLYRGGGDAALVRCHSGGERRSETGTDGARAPRGCGSAGGEGKGPREARGGRSRHDDRGSRLLRAPSLTSTAIGPVPEGILSVVLEQRAGFYKVLTPNENVGWLLGARVTPHHKTPAQPRTLEGATIVIDPGHGGDEPGAIGPSGLREMDANLAIARAVVAKLPGSRVFLTRTARRAGLAYRAGLANRLGAVAFVSIHNNSSPVLVGSRLPGSEVYHRVDDRESARLARLINEEVVKALKGFKISWGRNSIVGPKSRRSHEHGGDYYGVLRRARVPAVIVENMFITNAHEERLLRRPDVRVSLADAIGRGIKRFVETKP